eukprot:scaffold10282_cov107-Isochrysis_galbana.AAC.2
MIPTLLPYSFISTRPVLLARRSFVAKFLTLPRGALGVHRKRGEASKRGLICTRSAPKGRGSWRRPAELRLRPGRGARCRQGGARARCGGAEVGVWRRARREYRWWGGRVPSAVPLMHRRVRMLRLLSRRDALGHCGTPGPETAQIRCDVPRLVAPSADDEV